MKNASVQVDHCHKLVKTRQNMSWASLTRKLGRSRSVSAWSIKSGTKSVPISEEAVISSVIGSLLSTSILTKISDTLSVVVHVNDLKT